VLVQVQMVGNLGMVQPPSDRRTIPGRSRSLGGITRRRERSFNSAHCSGGGVTRMILGKACFPPAFYSATPFHESA